MERGTKKCVTNLTIDREVRCCNNVFNMDIWSWQQIWLHKVAAAAFRFLDRRACSMSKLRSRRFYIRDKKRGWTRVPQRTESGLCATPIYWEWQTRCQPQDWIIFGWGNKNRRNKQTNFHFTEKLLRLKCWFSEIGIFSAIGQSALQGERGQEIKLRNGKYLSCSCFVPEEWAVGVIFMALLTMGGSSGISLAGVLREEANQEPQQRGAQGAWH